MIAHDSKDMIRYIMKLYRYHVRYAGHCISHDVWASNDEESRNNFVKEVNDGKYKIRKEITYSPSKMFITYEELSDTSK
jgi:hypothetical protein